VNEAVRWLMWEAKAAPGMTRELLAWALVRAPREAQIFGSEDRVVVICEVSPVPFPDPPAELIARPAQAWTFERVR